MGYENSTRINAANYYLFGSSLPGSFSENIYSHATNTWPGTVYDFSGCPISINMSPSTFSGVSAGALITPRHLLIASHALANFPVGGIVSFIDLAGNLVQREIVERSSLIDGDIRVVTLDSELTEVAVYKIPTLASMPTIIDQTIWCLNKSRRIITRTVTSISSSDNYINHAADSSGSTSLAPGDSSQPSFITRGTELILLGTHYSVATFPSVAHNLTAIQSYCNNTSQTVQTISIDPSTWVQTLNYPV